MEREAGGKFKKGHSGLKPKGAISQKTQDWENFGKHLLSVGLARAELILEASNDKDFMVYYLQLLEYFKPKMTRAESNVAGELKLIIERKISEMGGDDDI